ncbi:MAG: hypothetical protein AAF602_26440 [Myxococcota bacterium]
MAPPSFDGLGVFNLVEALVWFTYGIAVLVASRRTPHRGVGRVAGATFLLFGLSDLVELYTRAWYRPWWLAVYKAGCVVVLAGCYLGYRRQRAP